MHPPDQEAGTVVLDIVWDGSHYCAKCGSWVYRWINLMSPWAEGSAQLSPHCSHCVSRSFLQWLLTTKIMLEKGMAIFMKKICWYDPNSMGWSKFYKGKHTPPLLHIRLPQNCRPRTCPSRQANGQSQIELVIRKDHSQTLRVPLRKRDSFTSLKSFGTQPVQVSGEVSDGGQGPESFIGFFLPGDVDKASERLSVFVHGYFWSEGELQAVRYATEPEVRRVSKKVLEQKENAAIDCAHTNYISRKAHGCCEGVLLSILTWTAEYA